MIITRSSFEALKGPDGKNLTPVNIPSSDIHFVWMVHRGIKKKMAYMVLAVDLYEFIGTLNTAFIRNEEMSL